MKQVVIQGCDVLRRGEHGYRIDTGQDILISGDRIIDIYPTVAELADPSFARIDAKGMLAIPGLINTHAHVPMVLFREAVNDVPVERWFNDYIWQMEANLTPEDVYWGALLGHAEMIENGVTTVADRYFHMDQVATAVVESGIRANLVWTYFSSNGRQVFDETCRFVEKWQGKGGGQITTWLGPHSPYTVNPSDLRLCGSTARQMGIGIHIHVSETERQVRLSMEQYGITPIQLLANTGVLDVPSILGHCKFPTDDDLKLLGQARTGVAHAPKTYLKHASAIIDIARFQRAGVPVGLATDGAASNSTLNILEQLQLMALTQKQRARDATVMSVDEALDVAYRGGAAVMQQADQIGELAPGRLADIVLLRQDGIHFFPPYDRRANLVYTVRPSDIDTVLCGGRLLYSGGRHLTVDVKQAMKELRPRLDRLVRRVPEVRVAEYPT